MTDFFASPHVTQAFKGPVDILVSTVRTQGITAIYTGLSALVIGTAAKAGVRFLAFDQFRDMLKDSEGKTTGVRSVLGKKKIDQGVNDLCFCQYVQIALQLNPMSFLWMHHYSGIGSRNDRGAFGGNTNRDDQVMCHLLRTQNIR